MVKYWDGQGWIAIGAVHGVETVEIIPSTVQLLPEGPGFPGGSPLLFGEEEEPEIIMEFSME